MTKDNPVAAGVTHETPAAWRYISPAKNAKWTVQKNYPSQIEKWPGYTIEPLFAASPVQAGIDPLVAEIEAEPVAYRYRHSEQENWYFGPDYKGWWECQPLYSEALIRSQAERIAALEVERDTAWSDSEHDKESALSAERLGREYLDRAIAAESSIAEAREAMESCAALLETLAEDAQRRGDTATWAMASAMAENTRATLSRLKPGEKGGG